jgi:hypothetical protein
MFLIEIAKSLAGYRVGGQPVPESGNLPPTAGRIEGHVSR